MFIDESKIVGAIEKATKSVVNISTVRLVPHRHGFYYHEEPLKGVGSGVVLRSGGYILTNNHVIEGAKRMDVFLPDQEKHLGTLVGVDSFTDIAVVKIEADPPPGGLGDSDKLKVGQTVFALGNPLGLIGGPTVTSGVISALHRTIESDRGIFEDVLQTDAAINPGNSGGPLVDTEGKIIAINTALIPYAQGIGFAIPINLAKESADELITHRRIIRPWLGIATGIDVNERMASYYGFHTNKGVLVTRIYTGSPLSVAGIKPGDIILELDGAEIKNQKELRKEIIKKKVGEIAEIIVMRGTKKLKAKIQLREAP